MRNRVLLLIILGSTLLIAGGLAEGYREIAHFSQDIKRGEPHAQTALAADYYYGTGGVSQDYVMAAQWYRKAADQGFVVAQNNLGTMYEKGQGISQDTSEAMRLYREAAEQGYADAQNNLGRLNYFGVGIPKDDAEAAKWWLKAAEQGLAEAQANVGDMFRNGYGVAHDDIRAYMWIDLAAQHGNQNASADLQKLEQSLTPEQIAEAKRRAAEWKPTGEAKSFAGNPDAVLRARIDPPSHGSQDIQPR